MTATHFLIIQFRIPAMWEAPLAGPDCDMNVFLKHPITGYTVVPFKVIFAVKGTSYVRSSAS